MDVSVLVFFTLVFTGKRVVKPSKVTKEMDADRVSAISMFLCFSFVLYSFVE